jgi:hypothetical protein
VVKKASRKLNLGGVKNLLEIGKRRMADGNSERSGLTEAFCQLLANRYWIFFTSHRFMDRSYELLSTKSLISASKRKEI